MWPESSSINAVNLVKKIYYSSRDIEFFLGDYFFCSPCTRLADAARTWMDALSLRSIRTRCLDCDCQSAYNVCEISCLRPEILSQFLSYFCANTQQYVWRALAHSCNSVFFISLALIDLLMSRCIIFDALFLKMSECLTKECLLSVCCLYFSRLVNAAVITVAETICLTLVQWTDFSLRLSGV